MRVEKEGGQVIPHSEAEVPFVRPVQKEIERQESVGILTLIIGLDSQRNGDNVFDPLIWTITELQQKSETDKFTGQISVPAETRTVGENRRSNVLGALSEFTDDRTLPVVLKHLYEVESTYSDSRIIVGGSLADMAVFIYDGPLDISFQPICTDEVSPIGWIKKSTLDNQDALRGVLRQALEIDQREGLIKQALEDYYANRGKRHVVPDQLRSLKDFIEARGTNPDVAITKVIGKVN
jgi:hypothetical protein